MESQFLIQLNATPEQLSRLRALQANFVEICNAISPVMQESRCWNRVLLHHMVYHKMREQFPQTGSQMICNAVYSVTRAARAILQHPKSTWNIEQNPSAQLPKIVFLPTSPVFFDRHTLTLKGNRLSMYTLEGRMRFDLFLSLKNQQMFHQEKLKEVLLVNQGKDGFSLHFYFSASHTDEAQPMIDGQMPDNPMVVPHLSIQSHSTVVAS